MEYYVNGMYRRGIRRPAPHFGTSGAGFAIGQTAEAASRSARKRGSGCQTQAIGGALLAQDSGSQQNAGDDWPSVEIIEWEER
jgi:hypothetical protein